MNKKQRAETYDYLIVGGGSAGCVLANRLSENGKWRVCLIEAGPPDTHPFIHIPVGLMFTLRSNVLNWKYWTTPQKHCNQRRLFWPRGKTLGGSSSTNAMCYTRGNPLDYDEWAYLGNTGWSYADVLHYFKKLENFEHGANDFHGCDGFMSVIAPTYINPLAQTFLLAAIQAGFTFNHDFNASSQEGVGVYHIVQKGGKRCSNATAYLRPCEKRKNLTIITNTQAEKILFEGEKAIGVQCKDAIFYANKEVILSAGVIGSPHLLMLSGVGSKEELKKHHIPLVRDLPGVGENLQDHIDIHISDLDKSDHAMTIRFSALPRLVKNLFHYLMSSKGEFTSNFGQVGGFFKIHSKEDRPHFQWHLVAAVDTQHAQNLLATYHYSAYTLRVCLLHPLSRGRITLKSADPLEKPNIDPNYFADAKDLDDMVYAVKKSREILNQAIFRLHREREFEPGEKVQTDDQIRDYIRERCETIYHPVGTCKMGVDAMAVVNPELKIHGLKNIRVVDASIMPTIVSGNTNTPVTMIAEKAADMILADAAEN